MLIALAVIAASFAWSQVTTKTPILTKVYGQYNNRAFWMNLSPAFKYTPGGTLDVVFPPLPPFPVAGTIVGGASGVFELDTKKNPPELDIVYPAFQGEVSRVRTYGVTLQHDGIGWPLPEAAQRNIVVWANRLRTFEGPDYTVVNRKITSTSILPAHHVAIDYDK